MLPVGVLAAIAVVVGAVVMHRQLGRRASWTVVMGGLTVVAGVRSLAAIWLPHIGDGLTRQHWSSIAVLLATVPALTAGVLGGHPATRERQLLDR